MLSVVDEKLTNPQAAARCGITASTWRAYVATGRAPAKDGEYNARTPWWWASTVERWQQSRPKANAVHR